MHNFCSSHSAAQKLARLQQWLTRKNLNATVAYSDPTLTNTVPQGGTSYEQSSFTKAKVHLRRYAKVLP